jgi:hypothetical protein
MFLYMSIYLNVYSENMSVILCYSINVHLLKCSGYRGLAEEHVLFRVAEEQMMEKQVENGL